MGSRNTRLSGMHLQNSRNCVAGQCRVMQTRVGTFPGVLTGNGGRV
jgi:hypothetical protein